MRTREGAESPAGRAVTAFLVPFGCEMKQMAYSPQQLRLNVGDDRRRGTNPAANREEAVRGGVDYTGVDIGGGRRENVLWIGAIVCGADPTDRADLTVAQLEFAMMHSEPAADHGRRTVTRKARYDTPWPSSSIP